MRLEPSHGVAYRKEFRNKITSLVILAFWGCELLMSSTALAAPQGGVVTSGSAAINQSGSVTNVNQSTNTATINWTSFSTKPTETVNFNQPSASSITLNRVVGNEASVLQGALNATGKVFLINSNGILMTKGSTVNTAGFVASTLNLSDNDFNAGNYVFKANGSTGSVINMGTITARDGGYVAMLGNSVSNQGVITATKGTVALAGGDKITLNFNGDSLVSVTIDEGALAALVENKEAIYADGGKVILTAKAADELLSAQVNNSGVIQARTVDDLKGSIELYAHGGTTTVTGTLDASAPTAGDGGAIETSGDHVKIADNAVITTKSATGKSGSWLIDPDGFTISVNGDMTATALTTALNNGNVTIASTSGSGTDGDIDINEAVSWSKNTLTLNATNNIYVNAAMTATGSASLAANYGHVLDSSGTPTATASGTGNSDGTPYGLYTLQSATNGAYTGKIDFSGTGTVTMNGANYIVVNAQTTTHNTDGSVAVYGVDYVQANPSGNYVLGSNISTGYNGGSLDWSGGIGASSTPFSGNFNGFGHVFGTVWLTGTGFFDTIGSGATVSNLGITGSLNFYNGTATTAGMLANYNYGSIINSFASGSTVKNVTDVAGGLVGDNYGLIAQSYFNGSVYATKIAGGLVGINETSGKIVDSSIRGVGSSFSVTNASGVTTITHVGGFVGENAGKIERSWSNNQLLLTDSYSLAGDFVGLNTSTGTIDQCYAALLSNSTYSKGPNLAGFVYENNGTITNAYTTALDGSTGTWLAGFAYKNTGTISHAYAATYSANTTNAVRSGFVSNNTGTITDAYWYALTKTSGATTVTQAAVSGVTQLASYAAANAIANYAGFDTNIWGSSKAGNPILKNMLAYVTTASAATYGSATSAISTLGLKTAGLQGGVLRYYSGTTLTLSGTDSIAATATNPFAVVTDGGYVDAGARDASEVLTSASYSNIAGIVTVTPKTLTVTSVTASDKIYDGATTATLSNVTYTGLVEGQTLGIATSSVNFSDKNAGANKSVTGTYTAGDGTGKASNYTIASTAITTTASIEKKSITATGITANDKTYDGAVTASLSYALPGAISGDSITLGYAASFADKNAATGKTVTVSGISLSGGDSGNYTLNAPSTLTTTATINPLVLALYGIKGDDGVSAIPASNLTATNIVSGDTVTLGGTATVSSTPTSGSTYALTDTSSLTVSNPNYTVVGSVKTSYVIVGGAGLILNSVASGSANIATSTNAGGGTDTTVTTSTDKTVIDWTRFNIASGETVTFAQPATTSIVLNRVVGYEASVINGTLASNGRVFLINSNGILFAAGSSVNTAGLVASALQLTDANFNSGNYVFTVADSTSGSVVAKGDIIIADGGFLALASNNGVTASGSVKATGGKVILASADSLTLTLNTADTGLAGYAITGLDGATTVGGTINAAGGLIETAGKTITAASGLALTADTWSWTQDAVTIGGDFSAALVKSTPALSNLILNAFTGDITVNDALTWSTNMKLTLNAANAVTVNKAITASGAAAGLALTATKGDITIAAPLTVSGANAVATLAAGNGITVNGGITANGGLTLTAAHGDITVNAPLTASGATAVVALASGNGIAVNGDIIANGGLTLTAGKDITVNKAIATTGDNATLTFTATSGDITVNAPITASGASAAVALTAGKDITIDADLTLTGANAGLTMNYSGDYSILTKASYSAAVLDKNGIPVANAAPAGTVYASVTLSGANAKLTINGNAYSLIHSMADLAALDDATGTAAGYFALAQNIDASGATYAGSPIAAFSGTLAGLGHTVNNLKITDSGTSEYVGLIGQATKSTIRDIGVADATVVAAKFGGILAGEVTGSTVSNAYSTGTVSSKGGAWNGGLIASATTSVISDSYSDAEVSGGGGLIGTTDASTVTSCHATGNVAGGGGLIGTTYGTNIANSYATGDVGELLTAKIAGGLVGLFGSSDDETSGTSIVNSFAEGNVKGVQFVGGLVGQIYIDEQGTTISNCHATGNVQARRKDTFVAAVDGVGGLIGYADTSGKGSLTITNSYATGTVDAGDYIQNVGGLVGSLQTNGISSITNSYTTGTVSGTWITSSVGGLVGTASSTLNITDSHATGTIMGAGKVGGLVGSMYGGGAISGSYQTGILVGLSATAVIGPLVGKTGRPITYTNDYYNIENGKASETGTTGLTGDQQKDIDSYLDGTIDQKLADRAAEAAKAAEAARAALPGEAAIQGSQTSGQTVQSASRSSRSSLSAQADAPLTTSSIDSQIEYADSASYSADIDSINADGVQYDLRENTKDKKDKKK